MDGPGLSTLPSPAAGGTRKPKVILQDSLYKRRDRAKAFWNDRYFVFTEDGVLSYYHSAHAAKTNQPPKAQYTLASLPEAEISDLFVAKNGKQLIYCCKVTWAAPEAKTVDAESQFEDMDSITSAEQQQAAAAAAVVNNDEPPNLPTVPLTPTGASPRGKPSFLRRRRATSVGGKKDMSGARSIDEESITFLESKHHYQRRQEKINNALLARQQRQEAEEVPRIPHVVEVETNNNAHSPPTSVAAEEKEYLRAQYLTSEKESRKKNQRKIREGTKFAAAAGATVGVAVMTAGVGLLAGLLFLGAAAGSSGAAMTWGRPGKGEMILASADYEKMKRWKACLDASLESGSLAKSKWGQLFVGSNKRTVALFPAAAASMLKSPRDQRTVPLLEPRASRWQPLEGGWAAYLGTQGLRIFRQDRPRQSDLNNQEGRPCPPVKTNMVLNASALDAFLCLMSYGRLPPHHGLVPNSGQRASFSILERIDDNTDVIHMICTPLYLFPSWTTPRDFVLYRYWRHEEDGTFVVCYESVQHKDCPPQPNYCRGEMHQVFSIAPHKRAYRRKVGPSKEGKGGGSSGGPQESLMTAWVQVDPRGWVPTMPFSFLANQAYGDAFAVAALMQLLDIRDAIDQDRFIPVSLDEDEYRPAKLRSSFDLGEPPAGDLQRNQSMESNDVMVHDDMPNYDFAFAGRESIMQTDSPTGFCSHPAPFSRDKWAEPDANSFRVRGKNYMTDRLKINAGTSIGRLVAVDIVHVDAPIFSGMTTHPTERLQSALEKEKTLKDRGLVSDLPPFVFCVNIVLPGPPFYHGVFYYAIDDMSKIDGTNGTPSSALCRDFFFGQSDEFRDKTFKLIPQIVQGNFIVRKAVGSTPAIMGKKLRQLYVRTERSFEVVLDCGSSPVATGVIRLSLGYAKTLVVDMGFLFESSDESRLPERIFGCVRIRQPEFDARLLRKVKTPPIAA
uniref:START domain-containing protein n=2 Tax=Amphora coffeiformis TaxID=265554 RepID=A0A7S3L5S8_9STRA